MNNQTLEVLIKSSAESATNAINKLKNALGSLKSQLSGACEAAGGLGNLMFALSKLSLAGVLNAFAKLYSSIEAASNRAEELNLFNVVFKNIGKTGEETFSSLGLSATKFQNKLNETFGANKTDTLRYQALFQSMGENTGIKDKYAAIMSENLTKLTYDIASLYNTSEKSVSEALKSGVYAGQTKPLRKFGVDVTQGSLSPLLGQLGIDDRTISQMSQAEKQILRYIATMKQASVAMGDFADTIESPANQLKVLRNQFVELKTAIGNLFIGMFAQILPYVNAILMVLKEIARAIANLFGLQASDYNSGLSALEDTENYYDGIGNAASGASKEVAKLNRQTLKFDQINNLKSPTKSGSSGGSGSGGGISGGIDKRLLDALSGYDNLMDKVKMKATEIRDRWMQILGFKKVINPITGEVSFKYQGLAKTMENLTNWFKNLSARAKLFIGLGLAVVFGKIYNSVSKLVGGLVQTDTSMGKFLTTVGSKMTTFVKGLGIATIGVLTLNDALEDMKKNGIDTGNQIEGLGGALMTTFGAAQMGSVFGPIGTLIGGIAGGTYSLIKAIEGIGEAADREKAILENAKEESVKTLEEWTDSIQQMKDTMSESDSIMDYYSGLKVELDSIVDKNGKIKQGYEERAATIVDILGGALGVEIKIVDGVIQKYDELDKKIDELIQQKRAMAKLSILEEQYTEALKKEKKATEELEESRRLLNGFIEDQNKLVEDTAKKYNLSTQEFGLWAERIKQAQQSGDFKELTQTMLEFSAATGTDFNVEELDEYFKEIEKYNGYIADQREIYNNNAKAVQEYKDTITTYEKAYGLALQKNYKELDNYIDGEAQLLGKSDAEKKVYWRNQIKEAENTYKELRENQSKYTKEELDALWYANNDKYKYAQDHLNRLEALQKTRNGEITDEVVKEWLKMGEESVDSAMLEFRQLPDDIQNELLGKMNEAGATLGYQLKSSMSETMTPETKELKQKGIDICNQLKEGMKSVKLEKPITVTMKDQFSSQIQNLLGKTTWGRNLLKLVNVNTANGGSFFRGMFSSIPQFANGGLPNHGTLFTAGENGAEIVGNINRRTEVLNRSQIASAIYSAVSNAMSNANIGGGEVHLYAHTDEGVVIDRINRKTKQTGVCPINIPT